MSNERTSTFEMNEVIIEGLFGAKEDARLRMPTPQNPFLILTGVNGSGKSTFFRMILALQLHDYRTLTEVRFKQLSFLWTDSTELHVAREVSPDGQWASLIFAMRSSQGRIMSTDWQSGSYKLEEPESQRESTERESEELSNEPLMQFELERLRNTRRGGSYGARSADIPASSEMPEPVRRVMSRFRFEYVDASRITQNTKTDEGKQTFGNPASRQEWIPKNAVLRRTESASPAEEVSARIQKMAQIASEMTSDASDDADLLMKFLNASAPSSIGSIALAMTLQTVYKNVERHIDVQAEVAELEMLHRQFFENQRRTETEREAVISFYLELAMRRTSHAQALSDRIERFIDLCNSLFRGKRISYLKHTGLVTIAEYTGANIPISRLSSGEQHLIAVAGAAFFPIEGISKKDLEASVLLIDEPEISLHLLWQSKLRDALFALSKSGQKMMLATHSADILTGHLEREVVMPSPPRKRQIK